MSSFCFTSGNKDLDKLIYQYLNQARGLDTAKDIENLVQEGHYEHLRRILTKRLAFGTAGLRGKMGPGYSAMNDLVIIQTSQGVATYIDSLGISDELEEKKRKARGVVIGFDNRHNSRRFSELVAVAFILKGFKVYLYSSMVATPFVPYAVKKLNCLAGIMVTASHNPKEDNGYKVYWENGAQILSPIDKNIESCILQNLDPWPFSNRTSLIWTSPLCIDPLSEIECEYYRELNIDSIADPNDPDPTPLKTTYTAMHGVGYRFVKKAFDKLGYHNYVVVEEQMVPDPDFPTVHFPNPEEGNCLDLSISLANRHGSQLILANDPDADRLAVAEKKESGKWHVFTGNQIGALLGVWLWKNYPEEHKKNPESCFMVSSAVSSKILRSIAEVEGFQFCETLTGFKWMANHSDRLMSEGKHFIFAFEEAIGFMCGSHVMDKDGIQAGMHFAKMASMAYNEGKTSLQLLKEIYLKYGYHTSNNSYFLCYQEENMLKMFNKLRNYDDSNSKEPKKSNYPSSLKSDDKTFEIGDIRDLTIGYDSSQPDNSTALPSSKDVQMITFYFTNGCELTIRGSGTEPKLKYYAEMIVNAPEEEWQAVNDTLQELVDAVIANWIQPEEYGFLPRPS